MSPVGLARARKPAALRETAASGLHSRNEDFDVRLSLTEKHEPETILTMFPRFIVSTSILNKRF